MRKVVVILVIVGAAFVGMMLFAPGKPATGSSPGFRPKVPGWLARLLPDPPPAVPSAGTNPPSGLAAGANWSGDFTAKDGKLGFVRVELRSGPFLKVSVHEPGEDDQLLCVVAPGTPPPGGCGKDNMADSTKGGVMVHKGKATVRLEAPSAGVIFSVNG